MHNSLSKRDIIILVLLSPLCFLIFHGVAVCAWYYNQKSAIMSFIIFYGIFLCFLLHLSPYVIPKLEMGDRRRSLKMLSIFGGAREHIYFAEVGVWYGVTIFLYWHAYEVGVFRDELPISVLLVAYGYYAVATIVFVAVVTPGAFVVREIALIARLVTGLGRRIGGVIFLFIVIDAIYAAIYQLIYFTTPKSFSAELSSFVDALYFSTVTMATVGYGDIAPTAVISRLAVVSEIIVGLFLLAAILSSTISYSFRETGGDPNEV